MTTSKPRAKPANPGRTESEDVTVRAHIEALPSWQRELAKRIDAIVAMEVPDVQRAIKWQSVVYGQEGKGLFAIVSSFKTSLKVNFHRGASLNPIPPNGVGKEQRSLDIREGDHLDEDQLAAWIRQASRLPGFDT